MFEGTYFQHFRFEEDYRCDCDGDKDSFALPIHDPLTLDGAINILCSYGSVLHHFLVALLYSSASVFSRHCSCMIRSSEQYFRRLRIPHDGPSCGMRRRRKYRSTSMEDTTKIFSALEQYL